MGEQLRNASVAQSCFCEPPPLLVVGVCGRQEERNRSVPVVSDAGEVRRKGCCCRCCCVVVVLLS